MKFDVEGPLLLLILFDLCGALLKCEYVFTCEPVQSLSSPGTYPGPTRILGV